MSGVLSVLLVSALLIVGCDSFENRTARSFKNPHAQVGQLHNQALDRVLSDLKTIRGTIDSRRELFDTAESSLRAFAEERGAEIHEIDRVRWGRKVVADAPQRLRRMQTTGTTDRSSPRAVAALPDSVLAGLTSEQMRYIKEIAGLVEENPPVDQLENRLSALNQTAFDELGEEKSEVVLRASAVAESSYAYWVEHFEEWTEAVSQATSDSLTTGVRTSALTTKCDWNDGPNSGAGEAALESADDITWADLAGGIAGPWGAAATSTLQTVKEATDYMQGDTENDYVCEG